MGGSTCTTLPRLLPRLVPESLEGDAVVDPVAMADAMAAVARSLPRLQSAIVTGFSRCLNQRDIAMLISRSAAWRALQPRGRCRDPWPTEGP